MRNRNKILEEQLERGLLLEVDLDGDGALEQIFAPVKANLNKFGQILKDSAKLIGNDIGYLVKLTFGRLQSLSDLKQMRQENNTRRQSYISSIAKNSDELMSSWPDGKVTAMMLAPGLYFTSEGLSGVQTLTSQQFRREIGSYGFDNIPFIGTWFGARPGDRNEFLSAIERCEPGDGQCFDRAWKNFGGGGGGDDDTGTLSKLALRINDIFLFSHHTIRGEMLQEGEDSGGTIEISKEQMAIILPEIRKMIDEEYSDKRAKWMKNEIKFYEKIVKEASNVIAANMTLAGTNDSKEFFKTLGSLKEMGGDKMKDLDIDSIQNGFKEMGQKFKDDKESMEKLEKEFEENKIEKTEENLNKKLEEIILSSFKSTFLQELKSNLTDYYENVYTQITGGMTKEQQKACAKDPVAKEFLSKTIELENKLKDAMSKIKQS